MANKDSKNKCILSLFFLKQLQHTFSIYFQIPIEIIHLIVSKMNTRKTLNGDELCKPGQKYKKRCNTLFRGNCITPRDHKFVGKGLYRNEKYICLCEDVYTDEIDTGIDDDSDSDNEFSNECYYWYRDGKYLVFRATDTPNDSYVYPFEITDEQFNVIDLRMKKHFNKYF